MAYPAAKSGFTLEDLTKMGPDQIAQKRKLAEALLAESQGIRRIEHPLEGMAQMAQALIGNIKGARLDRAEREGKSGANALFSAGMGMGAFPPAPTPKTAPSSDYSGVADGPKGQEAYAAPGGMESYLANVIGSESGGNPNAKNPRSSATGLGQFIDSTWQTVAERHPELGLTPDGRTDPDQSKRALVAFTQDNAKSLTSAGIPITGGSLYAAHFLGDAGARKVLTAAPGTPISSLVGEGVIRANPFLRGMRVADFQSWAAKKGGMGPVTFDEGAAPTQVASLDPAAGMPPEAPAAAAPGAVPTAYSKIPEKDSMGLTDQRAKFMEWNPDPVGNEEKNLGSINPDLARVVRRAKEIAGIPFVVGSGRRDEAMQAKAVKWGWSKTNDSDHLGGNATDLWPLDEDGAVVFDPGRQAKIAGAMKQAAAELGVQIEAGADWKHPDRPHFGIKGGGTQVASLDPASGLPPEAPIPQAQQASLGEALIGGQPPIAASAAQVPPPVQAGTPAPLPQQQQVAQALIGQDPAMTLGAPPIQPGGPDMRTLMNMAGNEFMSPNQQKMIEALTGQRMKQADPEYQLDLETKRLQLDQLKNPQMTPAQKAELEWKQKEFDAQRGDKQAEYDLNVKKFGAEEADRLRQQADREADNARADSAEERQRREALTTTNIKDYEAYKRDEVNAGREPLGRLEYEQSLRKSGAATNTVNVGEGDKFYENLDKKQAEIFGALSDTGIQGRSKLALIDQLGGMLTSAGTGGLAAIKQTAGEWGIPTEGLSDIQAAQALINKLVPEQRQPGSGPMSDRDLELFKASLPRLINQPGGNEKIIGTLRGITQYQIQMGEIADAVADREMTPAEARKAIKALPNPLADFGKAAPPTVAKPVTEMTDEELEELAK